MGNLPSIKTSTSVALYNRIFDSDTPEAVVSEIPSQSIYSIIKDRGIESCTDLLNILPIEVYKTVLDFDLWGKDSFTEDNVWNWLAVSEEEDPLRLIQKFFKSVDLKLLSLLIGRHVQVLVFDEPSDVPPDGGWYTPDKGYTWLNVTIEDTDKHFHLNKLLALIFETNTDLFYQLLSIPNVSTLTNLEEEAYLDKSKRLAADGVPEVEQYIEMNSSLFPYQVKEELNNEIKSPKLINSPITEPILSSALSRKIQPLDDLLIELNNFEQSLGELTLIINSSLLFFGVPFYETDAVKLHGQKVKGAINIGLEKLSSLTDRTLSESVQILGLAKVYRLGLFELRRLHPHVKSLKIDEIKALQENPSFFSIIAHILEPFPTIPEFFQDEIQGKVVDGAQLSTLPAPICHISEIDLTIERVLKEIHKNKSEI